MSVSFPIGFGSGFNPKLTIRENLASIARLYGVNSRELADYVSYIIGAQHMDKDVAKITVGVRSNLIYSLGFAIPFDVYIGNGALTVAEEPFRTRMLVNMQNRLQTAGLIYLSGSARTIKLYCDLVAVFENGGLRIFSDFDRAIESLISAEIMSRAAHKASEDDL